MVLVSSSIFERPQSELVQLFIDGAQDYAMIMLDKHGRVATWNAGAERIFGYRPNEILNRDSAVFFTQEDRTSSALQKEMERALQMGAFEYARWQVRRNGVQFWSTGTLRPIYDDMGLLIGFARVIRDATESKRAEDEVRSTHAQSIDILEGISDAFYAIDRDFNFTYVNRKTEEWWGRPRREIIGRSYWSVFPESVGSESAQEHNRAMQEGRPIHFETISPIINRWVEVNIYPTSNGLSVYFREIGERKRREHQVGVALEKQSRIAESLQRAMLQAGITTSFPGISVDTLYEAALDEADIGGDFMDAFPLTDGKVLLAVGDVSGKGLRAASKTAEVKYALRAFAFSNHDPAEILEQLNRFVYFMHSRDSHSETTFITTGIIVVDPATGSATAAVAGADPPLILRADGAIDTIRAGGMPIGIVPASQYVSAQAAVSPGDTLLLATDGITEARNGREFLGVEGMAALAQEIGPNASLSDILRGIYRGSCDYAGGVQRDDACILAARLKVQ